MTACIVGWAHSRFGKLEGEDIESLIVRVAGDAIARCRHRARRHRRDFRRHLQWRLRAPGISVLAGAAARSGAALQARDAGRECLRHRLGRDPSGLERDRGQARAHRAGRRRREDDRGHRAAGRRHPDPRRLSARGGRDRGRLRRRVRPHRPGLFPALWRQVATRSRASPPRTTRTARPIRWRRCRRIWATNSAAPCRTRTRWSRGRCAAPIARSSRTARRRWCWPMSRPRSHATRRWCSAPPSRSTTSCR